jgi:hypothetical protein
MIADGETFTELTVHMKLASDALLKTARHLALLTHHPDCDERCVGALDELMTMAIELATMERILRALIDANRAESAVLSLGS